MGDKSSGSGAIPAANSGRDLPDSACGLSPLGGVCLSTGTGNNPRREQREGPSGQRLRPLSPGGVCLSTGTGNNPRREQREGPSGQRLRPISPGGVCLSTGTGNNPRREQREGSMFGVSISPQAIHHKSGAWPCYGGLSYRFDRFTFSCGSTRLEARQGYKRLRQQQH